MERITQSEGVLLGYSPQRLTGNPSSEQRKPSRNSDVDFRDVFGGPPRRYSIQETRYSSSETTDSNALGEEEVVQSRGPWAGLSEKPVFGEESANRRRGQSNDFFDDIFKGEDSYSSPKKSDPFCSTPGSRCLSPAHPLPPKVETFGSPVLPPFSLPAKVTKAMELPAFGSGNGSLYKYRDANSNGISASSGSSSSMSRFSAQAIQGQDDLKNDFRQYFRQNSLSHEYSRNSKEYSDLINSDELELGHNLKKGAKGAEPLSNGVPFHFSIYKWASKGVPSLMPLRRGSSFNSREKGKTGRCSSSNGRIKCDSNVCQLTTSEISGLDSPLNHHISPIVESSMLETEEQENDSLLNRSSYSRLKSCQTSDESLVVIPESKSLNNFQSSVEKTPDDIVVHKKEEDTKPHTLPEIGFQEKVAKEVPLSRQVRKKHDLEPLQSLFKDKDKDQGNNLVPRKVEEKTSARIAQVLSSHVDLAENVEKVKNDGKKITSNMVDMHKANSQSPAVFSENNRGRTGVKGKVKEFVKIFNQEPPLKPNTDDSQIPTANRQGRGTSGAYGDTHVNIKGTDAKLNMSDIKDVDKDSNEVKKQRSRTKMSRHERIDKSSGENSASAKPDVDSQILTANRQGRGTSGAYGDTHVSIKGTDAKLNMFDIKDVNKDSNEVKKQPSRTKVSRHERIDKSSGENIASAKSSESLAAASKDTLRKTDDNFEDNFVIKELPIELDKVEVLQSSEDHEDMKGSEAKIQQWSKGKEGNIRSLLSTLQYVLWPKSGWKPVPLVDIIEGSAVKRAYQKALLCLHPDKLQQKGAAPHQKYIAEKVFDILQEAWDHYNTLSSL